MEARPACSRNCLVTYNFKTSGIVMVAWAAVSSDVLQIKIHRVLLQWAAVNGVAQMSCEATKYDASGIATSQSLVQTSCKLTNYRHRISRQFKASAVDVVRTSCKLRN